MSCLMRWSSGTTIVTPRSFRKPPDELAVGALGDLDDRAFGAAARVEAGALDQHPVAVHHLLHLARTAGTRRHRQRRAAGSRSRRDARCTRPAMKSSLLASSSTPLRLGSSWPSRSIASRRRSSIVEVAVAGTSSASASSRGVSGPSAWRRHSRISSRVGRHPVLSSSPASTPGGLATREQRGRGFDKSVGFIKLRASVGHALEGVRSPDGGIGRRTRFRS